MTVEAGEEACRREVTGSYVRAEDKVETTLQDGLGRLGRFIDHQAAANDLVACDLRLYQMTIPRPP